MFLNQMLEGVGLCHAGWKPIAHLKMQKYYIAFIEEMEGIVAKHE